MVTTHEPALKLSFPSDRETVMTRVFNAPRALVFEAITKPEHVRRWYGLRSLTMTICEIDLRPGGVWRYVTQAADGSEFGFTGVYQEILPPERIVSSEWFEAMPEYDYLATVTLAEHAGQTTLTSHLLYKSPEERDGHLNSGMEPGAAETYDRLAELLATMR